MDVFIPNEILKIKDLNITEKVVLAIYKYYTEQGKYKCCSLSKPQIANELGISVDYVKKIKNHLIELGYIKSDGGIKVIYLGVQVGNIVPNGGEYSTQWGVIEYPVGGNIVPNGGEYSTQWGVIEYPVGGNIVPSGGVIEYPHKKEKKEKENKKEEKRDMTNFDLLLERLPKDYKTEERMEYMKEHYRDRINDMDVSGGVFDIWLVNVKNELNKLFPMEYKVETKEEEVNDTIEMF